ncbi:MAG: hypothetical protein ACREU3_11485 [Steroidobacteraceae bacterium]
MENATTTTPRQQAHRLLDTLPEDASWERLAYTLEVRADIEAGLADVAAGRVTPHEEVRREFGLPE